MISFVPFPCCLIQSQVSSYIPEFPVNRGRPANSTTSQQTWRSHTSFSALNFPEKKKFIVQCVGGQNTNVFLISG